MGGGCLSSDLSPTRLSGDGLDGEPVDRTEELAIHSKRTERKKKKQLKKQLSGPRATGSDLPPELWLEIISLLRPSDVFRLSRTSTSMYGFIETNRAYLGNRIMANRYQSLQKCFRLPVLLENIEAQEREALQFKRSMDWTTKFKRPFKHILPPDHAYICTCLSCGLRWHALCIAVDFAHWQERLDNGVPLPTIDFWKDPAWNQRLVEKHAAQVKKAIHDSLWYAALLQVHLDSTTRAIRRHIANRGNRRPKFLMTEQDVLDGTDEFLDRSGPPTIDFPYHRDNYYMLGAFMPSRGWKSEESRWAYMPEEQHNEDLARLVRRHENAQQATALPHTRSDLAEDGEQANQRQHGEQGS